jgi:hypothetical protein
VRRGIQTIHKEDIVKAALTVITTLLAATFAWAGGHSDYLCVPERPPEYEAIECDIDQPDPGIGFVREIPEWQHEWVEPPAEYDRELPRELVVPPVRFDWVGWPEVEELPPVELDEGNFATELTSPQNPFGLAYPTIGSPKAVPPVGMDGPGWTSGVLRSKNPFSLERWTDGPPNREEILRRGGNVTVPSGEFSSNPSNETDGPPNREEILRRGGNVTVPSGEFSSNPSNETNGSNWPPAEQALPPVMLY